jgi:opacity protein-like surface antigen
MKRFVMAMALACALSATALAGEVPSTGAPAPAQPTASQGSSRVLVTIILTVLSVVGK